MFHAPAPSLKAEVLLCWQVLVWTTRQPVLLLGHREVLAQMDWWPFAHPPCLGVHLSIACARACPPAHPCNQPKPDLPAACTLYMRSVRLPTPPSTSPCPRSPRPRGIEHRASSRHQCSPPLLGQARLLVTVCAECFCSCAFLTVNLPASLVHPLLLLVPLHHWGSCSSPVCCSLQVQHPSSAPPLALCGSLPDLLRHPLTTFHHLNHAIAS